MCVVFPRTTNAKIWNAKVVAIARLKMSKIQNRMATYQTRSHINEPLQQNNKKIDGEKVLHNATIPFIQTYTSI